MNQREQYRRSVAHQMLSFPFKALSRTASNYHVEIQARDRICLDQTASRIRLQRFRHDEKPKIERAAYLGPRLSG